VGVLSFDALFRNCHAEGAVVMEILRSPADAIDDLADYRAERGWVEIPLFLQQRLGAGP